MSGKKSWGYGSGFVGCLFDNMSDELLDSRDAAIDSVLFQFEDLEDLSDEVLTEARNSLENDDVYYFPADVRPIIGADLVQIWSVERSDEDEEEFTLNITITLPATSEHVEMNIENNLCKHCGAIKNVKDENFERLLCPYEQYHDVDEDDEHEVPTVKGHLCDCHKTCSPGTHETWCRVDKIVNGD